MTLKTSKIQISGLTYEFEDTSTKGKLDKEVDRAEKTEKELKKDLTAVTSEVTKLSSKISILTGTGEGSVTKQIDDAIAKQAETNSEVFDKIKDISDWIEEDKTGSASLIQKVQELDETKASETGYHPHMTTGLSDNLVGHGEAIERVFNFGPTGGTYSIEDGNARIKKIKGNTIVWNQLAKIRPTKTINGVTIESMGDGSYKVYTEKDTPSTGKVEFHIEDSLQGVGRKLFISGSPVDSTTGTYCLVSSPRAELGYGTIIETVTEYSGLTIFVNENITINTPIIFRPQLIDLTLMFGAGNEPTTASEFRTYFPESYYPYNPGELISLNHEKIRTIGFNQLNLAGRTKHIFEKGYTPTDTHPFSEDEYWVGIAPNGHAYSSKDFYTITELTENSIKATRNTNIEYSGYGIGFPVRVDPRYNYQLAFDWVYDSNGDRSSEITFGYFDKEGRLIDYGYYPQKQKPFTIIKNTYWLLIVFSINFKLPTDSTSYNKIEINNINLNLTHTGYRDGEVLPYEDFTRDFSQIKEIKDPTTGEILFPDGLRSAGNVYDEITSTHAIKRIGVIEDLENLDWYRSETNTSGKYRFVAKNAMSNNKLVNGHTAANATFSYPLSIIGSGYTYEPYREGIGLGATDGTLYVYSEKLSSKTVGEFKELMSGHKLYYELENPIVVELSDPLNLDYKVWDFGTEEAISILPSAPFRADIVYGFNAVDTVRTNKLGIDEFKDFMDRMKSGLGCTDYQDLADRLLSLLGSIPTVAYEDGSTELANLYEPNSITEEEGE